MISGFFLIIYLGPITLILVVSIVYVTFIISFITYRLPSGVLVISLPLNMTCNVY